MLVLYILGTGLAMAIAFFFYSEAIDRHGSGRTKSRKGELAGNMWRAPHLDCDFEPTKNAFGPGRSVQLRLHERQS